MLIFGLVCACATSVNVDGAVHVLKVDGAIDPVTARYIDRGIDEAERTDGKAVVIEIDTPGGLDSAMRDIVKRINSSDVPIITYVYPSGGRAASAGTFIVMAGHVAAMAPNTSIGAAHPVGAGGQDIEGNLGDKVTNDAVSYIRGIANERGRNADWAERSVRFSDSIDSDEAVQLGVVDFEARTLDSVIEQSNGRTVQVQGQPVTLDILDAPVVENNMTILEQGLSLISDPNIAFLLLSLGALALVFEFVVPGHIFPGVFGAIALILAFFALGTLPVNWAGVALIFLAFILFAAEAYVTGFGVLGIGGIIALIFGGLILFSTNNSDFQVNRWLLITVAIVMGAFFVSAASAVLTGRRMPARSGSQSLVGRVAIARTALDPQGFVFLDGARWKATAEDGPVDEGQRVKVTEVSGLKLRVKKNVEAAQEAPIERPQEERQA